MGRCTDAKDSANDDDEKNKKRWRETNDGNSYSDSIMMQQERKQQATSILDFGKNIKQTNKQASKKKRARIGVQ